MGVNAPLPESPAPYPRVLEMVMRMGSSFDAVKGPTVRNKPVNDTYVRKNQGNARVNSIAGTGLTNL